MSKKEEKKKDIETTEEILETETDVQEENIQDASLEAEVSAYKDKLLRLTAEFDNFRKRTAKEKESLFSDGRADCLLAFLPLIDNLERFEEAVAAEAEDHPLRVGFEKITKQLADILKSLSVTEIPALGETFDPNLHNAVMHIEDDKIDEATVVEQFQKGYLMDGKVLRFSMVKVAN